MAVPNLFATATSCRLVDLDANFAYLVTNPVVSRTYTGVGPTVMNDNVQTVNGNGLDVGSVRGFMSLAATAVNCLVRGVESHTSVNSGASFSEVFGIEIGLHSQVAGSGSLTNPTSIGVFIASSHTGWLPTGVRNDCGLFIGGEDGWVVPILVNDTDTVTALFRVTQTGGVFAKGTVLFNMADDASGANLQVNGFARFGAGTAITAGGSVNSSIRIGPTGSAVGVFAGSGAPTITATQGSLYMRTDGTTTNNRAYVSQGGGSWTALITAA